MNACPGPDGRTTGETRERPPVPGPPVHRADPAVPRQQQRGDGPAVPPCPAADDPLEHPDPVRAADAAARENLLRCWVRENGLPRPGGPGWAGGSGRPGGSGETVLRIALASCGLVLRVPVRHWSATGWHRFGAPVLEGAMPPGVSRTVPLDAVTLAALLAREAAHRGAVAPGTAVAGTAELVGRVADSLRHTAVFLADRRARPEPPPGTDPFLAGEQSLLLGHPLHPVPKSREGLSDAETRAWSPELRGSFPLHWMAVDRRILAADSAWTERGRTVPAELLADRLAGGERGPRRPEGTVPLPLHPWQAREVRHRPAVAALLEAGLLHELGARGERWYPTSSVRTVHRPGTPAMLKLSLGLRITNSRRENLRKELHRGVEAHRLLRTGLGERWRAAFPGRYGFDVVRDPAWLAVDDERGEPVGGLDVVIRHNPFTAGGVPGEAVCLAGLVSPRPWPGAPGGALRSRLADAVVSLAARTGRPVATIAAEWFLRYLHTVVRPVLWLDAEAGVALEAHQQNTVVLLDGDGWPAGGRYRDNQGYYFRASRREELWRRLPGVGEAGDTFVADEVVDERFAYYLGVNNVLGLIGAFGSQHLADERTLLAALRHFLTAADRPADGGRRSPLPALLLDSPTLRCKANLLTRLHGLDELVGPVDTQSVYVTVANPLVRP
ncbi:IucA/IucC family protein [Streptomyces sp. TRM 70361]|uniref:IucA/IucC family protein n=1 Tax=Streptomyces sp. TRM 70361 TaxID=3116553 RepID=UPI002E7BA8DD|nr:IucA/IucC family protein [Streptomyces sp. TRM 70361]MEE1940893.1 IucA/IucC family protein [Streptomyces sp. TRM 70361]